MMLNKKDTNTWLNQEAYTEIEQDDVHVWINYLNVHEARMKHLYPLLSTAEKERSERFKFYKHRKAFIASHGFMHTVLAYYIDTPANEINFSHNEYGKPFIIEQQNPDNIQFNLSHSNNMVILAISKNHAVGIDIEYAQRKTDWQGISKRFFTENEQKKLFKLPVNLQKNAFYQVWTRKEAHMKVTGKGLSLAPTQFEVSIPPEKAAFIKNLKIPNENIYNMKDIFIPDMFKDYFACLSANFDFKTVTQFIHS